MTIRMHARGMNEGGPSVRDDRGALSGAVVEDVRVLAPAQ